MMQNAGIILEVMSADIDEDEEKERLVQLAPKPIAVQLAAAKARALSSRLVSRLVIGCDQTLELDGALLGKPVSRDDARNQLRSLRGRTHVLHSAACCFEGGRKLWSACRSARLTMRKFSDRFLDEYLDACGDDVLTSVGGYKVEGLGLQLFSRIDGDYHTILGMPLLPLLGFLRERGVIPS
jgi:septum formation protein